MNDSPEWPPVKAQNVRLMDMYVLGPAMMVAGLMVAQRTPWLGLFMVVSGGGTSIFNAVNYGRVKEREHMAAGLPYLGRLR